AVGSGDRTDESAPGGRALDALRHRAALHDSPPSRRLQRPARAREICGDGRPVPAGVPPPVRIPRALRAAAAAPRLGNEGLPRNGGGREQGADGSGGGSGAHTRRRKAEIVTGESGPIGCGYGNFFSAPLTFGVVSEPSGPTAKI